MGLTLSPMEKEHDSPRKLVSLNIATKESIGDLPGIYEADNYCVQCCNSCCDCCCDNTYDTNEREAWFRAIAIMRARPITSWDQVAKIKGMSTKRVNKLKQYAEYTTPSFPNDLCPYECDKSHIWSTYSEIYEDWDDYKNHFPRYPPFCTRCNASAGSINSKEICPGSDAWREKYRLAEEQQKKEIKKPKEQLVPIEIPNKGIFMVPISQNKFKIENVKK
jgi:hypothetical protein